MRVESVVAHWFDQARLEKLGSGHIHDTYSATVGDKRYVLQRVNHLVFKDPERVMAQTARVLSQWSVQSDYVVPQLCATKNGAYGLWIDDDYWRVWHFIQPSVIVDPIENIHQARAAGLAFARFQAGLQSMAGSVLQPTIEGFLQLKHYLSAYDVVAATAPKDMQTLIQAHRALAAQLSTPNAYIHGDCKINNLLFAPDRLQVRAIIDFDTVMYGHWAWDLGDLVRSVCYSRGKADVDFFAACLHGFGQAQKQTNVADSVAAPSYVTLMLGIRFLTDHLTGDRYFRVRQPGENLTRAEEQFTLFADLQKKRAEFVEAAEAILRTRD